MQKRNSLQDHKSYILQLPGQNILLMLDIPHIHCETNKVYLRDITLYLLLCSLTPQFLF